MRMKSKHAPGFSICDNKGFHIRMSNGITISVQFGAGNYADNHDSGDYSGTTPTTSSCAEIAVYLPDGRLLPMPSGDTVQGWVSADDVARFIGALVALEHPTPKSIQAVAPKYKPNA